MEQPNKNNSSTALPRRGEQTKRLFSESDVDSLVKAFVRSWINGEIEVQFPCSYDFINEGHCRTEGEADKAEKEYRDSFLSLVEVITGHKVSEPMELEKAISTMFNNILRFRYGLRIKGTFLTQEEYGGRITKVEKEINAMNNLIEELLIAYRSLPKR